MPYSSPHSATFGAGFKLYWILLTLCVLAHFPALAFTFGVTDDYAYLWTSLNGSAKEFGNNFVWSVGRIPWALFHPYLFEQVATVENLVWLRATSMIFVWGTACAFLLAFRQGGFSTAAAITATALLCFNPANALIVSWTAALNIAAANCLAAWSGIAFHRIFLNTASPRSNPVKRLIIWLAFLLLNTFLVAVYQTSIGFFPVIILILSWQSIRHDWKQFQPIIHAFALFTLPSAIYTLAYWKWIVPSWGDPTYTEAARLSLNPEKLLQLFDQLVYANLGGWFWTLGTGPAFIAFIVQSTLMLVGLYASCSRPTIESRYRVSALLLTGACAVGSIAIISLQPLQALAAPFAFYAVLAGFGIQHLKDIAPRWNAFCAGLGRALLCGLPLIAAFVSWHTLIQPHHREYTLLRESVQEITQEGIPAEVRILAGPMITHSEACRPGFLRERFGVAGLYSTSFGWAIDNLWNLILAAEHSDWLEQWATKPTRIEFTPSSDKRSLATIDIFSRMEPLPSSTIQDPHFGAVYPLRDGWYFSSWFGYFQRHDTHRIYHPVLGPSVALNRYEHAIFMQSGSTLWACLPEQFPFIQIQGEGYYLDISTNHWTGLFVINLESGEGRHFPFQ